MGKRAQQPVQERRHARAEMGTGKEIFARGIPLGSERRGADFVAVSCAAFPDTLLARGDSSATCAGASPADR
jgi:DNA-binding NtrC family response regulator